MTRELRMGDWLVEPQLNRISRGETAVSLQPKVVEVLLFLADHPGEVLSKETIIKAVWPDTFVSDDVLTYSISELRKALSDDAKNPQYIQTILRKGYRLIAPVAHHVAAAAPQPSVAVLAFSDMSPEKDQDYFCEGIAEEIINRLAHFQGLRVASRTSAFSFKGRSENVRTIGRQLGVSTVLEGSIRKAENRLRITVQLIDVDSGYHLWSERYDRELRDIFAIQDEISQSIAATLNVALSPGDGTVGRRVHTTNPQAYDYYLRGRQFFYRYTIKGIEFALRLFFQAIETDPAYALAHAGLADCCSFLYMYAGSRNEHREQADAASRNAVELDPQSAEARAARGVSLSLQGRYREAEREFEAAIRLNPRLYEAHYFYARAAFAQGNPEKAIELYEKAGEVNPQDYQAPLLVAQIYSDLGRLEEAASSRRRGVEVASARLKMNPDDTRALYMGANGLVALGDMERGVEWARQALAMEPDDPMVLYNVACIQTLAGRIEEALDALERAVANGLAQKGWVEHDSNLDPLRGNPRYRALIRRLEDPGREL